MSILDEIAGDSEKGAERLVGMYGGRLTAAAMSLCGNETDAKDLVWDTVDVAVRQVEAYRGEAAVFEWLYGIMQNLYRHSRRRKSATNEIPMADLPDESVEGPIDGAAQIVQEIDAGILRAAVDALPPDMRESIILRYFMDMPLMQIAKFLSLPVGTVKSRLHYARIALARRLGGNLKKTAVALILVALMLAGVTYAATAVISSYMEKGDAAPISETTPTVKENKTMKTERSNVVKLGRKVRNLLAASSTLLAVIQGQAATLFFSPAEGDSTSWDNTPAWKLDEPPSYAQVNRLPTDDDDVTLNSIRIALAGEGVTTPHALQIGNGVRAEAKTVKIASAAAGEASTYAKTGRVIGMEIGNGGLLHTADMFDSLQIGASTAGYGVLTMTGGMISNYAVNVGYRGIGVMTNAGGTVFFRGRMSSGAYRGMAIGSTAGSTGTLAMTSGIITHNGVDWNADSIMVGYSGEGTFELSGGTVSNRVLVGSTASGRGHVKMSGGTIVNRVFVGVDSAEMNEFDFTGGRIVGDIYVGTRGRGRMTFDGGVHHVHPNINLVVPGYTGTWATYGLTVGNFAGSHGELIVKKPGLTFEMSQAEPALVCGRLGEGHVETFVDLEMSYLRVGGNSDAMSSYEAYANTTTTVRKVALAGGYGLYEPSTDSTSTYPGTGEIVLSNAVMRFTRTDATTPLLSLGRYEGSFGILRGCGAVQGKTPTGNNARMGLGEGQVIGDGFGEQKTLDLNAVVSVTNFVANADDGTNGWYAVNKGAVLFPRVWSTAASDTRIIGAWTRNATPDFVNSVGFTLNNVASPGSGYYVRGGVYAADRSDVHADSLPKSGEVVGIWKMGVFTDLIALTAKSFQSVGLTFRYDHTKVKRDDLLNLYRWNGSAWSRVATAKATDNPRISCSGLAPVAGMSYNIGTFALMSRGTRGLRMIIR